jgi:hypothetical protein
MHEKQVIVNIYKSRKPEKNTVWIIKKQSNINKIPRHEILREYISVKPNCKKSLMKTKTQVCLIYNLPINWYFVASRCPLKWYCMSDTGFGSTTIHHQSFSSLTFNYTFKHLKTLVNT